MLILGFLGERVSFDTSRRVMLSSPKRSGGRIETQGAGSQHTAWPRYAPKGTTRPALRLKLTYMGAYPEAVKRGPPQTYPKPTTHC